MRNISINYTQLEDVIRIYDSVTDKFEDVRVAPSKTNKNRKVASIPATPSLAAHIAIQISTA